MTPPATPRYGRSSSTSSARPTADAAVGFAFQLPGFPVQGVFLEHGMRHPDPAFLDVFVEHHKRGLPWSIGYAKNFVGRFGLASEVLPDSMVAETAYYHEFMKPLGLAACGPIGHTIALEDGRPSAVIALFKREGLRPWRPRDCALGDLLVPHLARAYADAPARTRERRARGGAGSPADRRDAARRARPGGAAEPQRRSHPRARRRPASRRRTCRARRARPTTWCSSR